MKKKIVFFLISVSIAITAPYLFRHMVGIAQNYLFTTIPANDDDDDGHHVPTNDNRPAAEDVQMFTAKELSRYDGTDASGGLLYLCILGRVYDVTRGAAHYGPGGSYNVFIGKISLCEHFKTHII